MADPISKDVLNEIYNGAQAGINAGAALAPSGVSSIITIKQTGVDILKNYAENTNESSYAKVGRVTGNFVNAVLTIWSGGKMKGATLKTKAGAGAATSEILAHIDLPSSFAVAFDTYIRQADEFYTEILTNTNYASNVWDGLVENGITTYVDYFDPDRDGNVSPEDIVNGYKKLFGALPSSGQTDFELIFDTNNPTEIKITLPKDNKLKQAAVEEISKVDSFKTIEINNVQFNITQTNNLTIVNALDDIPAVSILLTHINIQVGEQLDLGDKGLYTVKGGDTLSEIAEANGYVTKDLLKLNTWLIDDGRVTFDQDKVLIKTDANDLTNQNHVLTGEFDAKNILKDYNGGDDVLVGGSQADIMEGGSGFDTYVANDGDTIKDDSDGKGKVFFNNTDLTGTKTLLEGMDDMYEDDEFVYEDGGSTLTVTHKQGEGSITINNWGNGGLGINLQETEDIEISVTNNAEELEATEMMRFGVELQRELTQDENLKVDLGYYTPTL